MSMPSFPVYDPNITCENAINMILTSIAMEELALSHIMNAEGEKLQAVLKHLELPGNQCGGKYPVDELLKVNKSIADLLDSVSQNQMLLKSKMERALEALSDPSCCKQSKPDKPPCPDNPNPDKPCACKKCSAFFTGKKCGKWCPGTALPWHSVHQHGDCVRQAPCDPSRIEILKKGRYLISFLLSVKGFCNQAAKQEVAVAVVDSDGNTLYTVYAQAPRQDMMSSISLSGMPVDTLERGMPYSLYIHLKSGDPLTVEHAAFSIAET
jgi:hypothetical protein